MAFLKPILAPSFSYFLAKTVKVERNECDLVKLAMFELLWTRLHENVLGDQVSDAEVGESLAVKRKLVTVSGKKTPQGKFVQ